MARFRPKDYLMPNSVKEATSILHDHHPRAKVLAGGTSFYELAMRGMMPGVELIVDLERAGLDYIKQNGSVRLGAMATLSRLIKEDIIKAPAYGALNDLLEDFTPIQIRNVATIGGEVCAAIPFLDLPPALMVLGARLRIVGDDRERIIGLEGFHHDFFVTDLRRGELLVEVILPTIDGRVGSAFTRIKRNAVDLSLVNTSAKVELGKGDECSSISLALGGMGRTFIRARKAESLLKDRSLEPRLIEEACEVLSELKPPSAVQAPSEYKREVCKVLAREAIIKAWGRAKKVASFGY